MVAAGSDDAFATLYRRHHQAVYRYCLSILRQEADARDALQGSMVAALTSLRARPIEGAFKPWLFRIAHNQSISIIRGRTREAPTEAPPAVAVTDDPETREELRTLVSDLGALPSGSAARSSCASSAASATPRSRQRSARRRPAASSSCTRRGRPSRISGMAMR